MRKRSLAILATATVLIGAAAAAAAGPASAAGGCRVAYTVSSQWPGGFGAAVAVTNLGDPITGWTLTFSFPAGQKITQLWNGSATQSGAAVTVRDAGYNAAVRHRRHRVVRLQRQLDRDQPGAGVVRPQRRGLHRKRAHDHAAGHHPHGHDRTRHHPRRPPRRPLRPPVARSG